LKSLKHANASAEAKARVTALFTGGAAALAADAPMPPAADPAFQAMLDWVHRDHGRAPLPWGGCAGVFECAGRDHKDLAAIRRGVIDRGFFAAFGKIARNGMDVNLRIFPSPSPYAALHACGTSGGIAGHSTKEIVAWLRDLNRLHPYDLEACGVDFVLGRFHAPVGEAALFLARRMLDFCPDLRGGQAEPSQALARELQRKAAFHFRWS
jgi:hypothetical protein